jgi:site-specific recombinase XerD
LKNKSFWSQTRDTYRIILERHLKPAALRAAIGKISRHTYRHSYSSRLRAAKADIEVQQELLRYSTIQSTMNVYTQAV